MMFHGSYRPSQVTFLLKPIEVDAIEDTAAKERLIQSGQRHYSEMLSPEKRPSAEYLALFHAAHQANRQRMAIDCLRLAALIQQQKQQRSTLVSLARAGTPVGVILQEILSYLYAEHVPHYSVSIIRDRGIDANALNAILAQGHAAESLVFIDGWTGKGVINRELQDAIAAFNALHQVKIDGRLFVLTDLAGVTDCTASNDDYLIPSSILNACISGLISRSVLNQSIGADDYHGCVYFKEFEDVDLSQWFVDDIVKLARDHHKQHGLPPLSNTDALSARQRSQDFMTQYMTQYGIDDVNLIKPGIGEATRVLLRRLPERLLVQSASNPDVGHLLRLAEEKGVAVEQVSHLPYHAAAIIRSVNDA